MAVKFKHTFMYSTVTAAIMGVLFYVLSSRRSAVSEAYAVTDTNLGTVFVFLLALIIGLALWPRFIDRGK